MAFLDQVRMYACNKGWKMEFYQATNRIQRGTAGVYCVFDGMELLYVGLTHDVRSRLYQHKVYDKKRHTVGVIRVPNTLKGGGIEYWLIHTFNPPHNYYHRSDIPFKTSPC